MLRRVPIRRRGKRTIAWENARRYLKSRFLEWGITRCEWPWPHACWHDNGLSFAHSKKRLNMKGDEIYEVALLCPVAHNLVESLPEREMTKMIRKIIKTREEKLNEYCANEDD
jgi:hypothetical protein